MNAIDKTRVEMIENSIAENAKLGRMYSSDLLWHVYQEALDAIKAATEKKNPELWDLVDNAMVLQHAIDIKDNSALEDREAENLIYLVPEISHLTEVVKAK